METILSTPTLSIDTRILSDLHKHGYNNIEPDMMKDILYLEQLSSSTGTPIKDWEVIELLKPIERGNKRAINKLFFSKIPDKKQATGLIDDETFARIEKAIFDSTVKRKESRLYELRGSIRNQEERVKSKQLELNDRVAQLRLYHDEMSLFENTTPGVIVDGFKKILSNPFWIFERFAYSKAYFVTTSDVWIRYINTAQKIDWRVNFGKIRVRLDLNNCCITASKLENNLVLRSYFHPFISASGDICFGSKGSVAASLLAGYRFGDLFELLASLLSTYDGGSNPYISLGDFVQYEKSGGAVRVNPKTCDKCFVVEDSCECPWCEVCDGKVGHKTSECENHCGNCGRNKNTCGCVDEDDEIERCGDCENPLDECDCESSSF